MEPISYIMPVRGGEPLEVDDVAYLGWLAGEVDQVIVVDGSPELVFDANERALGGSRIDHLRAGSDDGAVNGKVIGVHVGVSASRNGAVVVADDDVRHDRSSLSQMVERLRSSDLVWPQNFFEPRPWHARWDTARSLINRSFGHDYPGTIALRRSAFLESGGYRADVLFENLELLRTLLACGRTVDIANDLYVRRRPPTLARFVSQRVRQAYDSFASPKRLAVELAIVPVLVRWIASRRWDFVALAAAGAACLAEIGRRAAGGTTVFGATDAMWAPLWVLERGVCSWIALLTRLTGGMPYAGSKIKDAATPRYELIEGRRSSIALGDG